jgi:hypothetical protein
MEDKLDAPIVSTNITAYDLNEVLDRVKNQDPTVTGVKVNFEFDDNEDSDSDEDSDVDDPPTIDWQVAANCMNGSRYVKYLSISAEFEKGEGGLQIIDRMIQFCYGLAGNKSIERLDLGIEDLEGGVNTERLFELFGQFLANNEKLESLVVEYKGCEWISKRSIQALCAGTSIRNISLRKTTVQDKEATREEEDLVCALIEHYPLQKLSFGDYLNGCWYSGDLIGRTVSSCMKSMLEDPKCKLESLSLNNIVKCMDINLSRIASGLAKNTSVKTIACKGGRPDFLLDINTENHTLEVLDLNCCWQDCNSEISIALNNFRALESLDLSGHKTTPEAWIAIFKLVLMPPSRLENLILCGIVGGLNDESLSALGECIAANKTLKRLNLADGWRRDITTTGWASFFRQLRKTAFLKLIVKLP